MAALNRKWSLRNRKFRGAWLGVVSALALGVQAHGLQAEPAEPTLQQRLDRLGEQLEKQRETLHIPGFAIAIVKDDKVILSRGFGVRDVDQKLPVTDDTLFAIGSSSKAFTATLIGMLMDEGKMNWDDPVRKYLPDFHLKDAMADEKIQIRDLLCHRSGLARTDLLWGSGKATRAEILSTIANAELFSPFREKFNYNNVMFLAAGEAAGKAADSDWDTLVAQRLFKPLGMSDTTTKYEVAQRDPMLSKGYMWNEDKSEFDHLPMRNLANIAPAGAINSTARDMAQWVRFQLAKGAIDGKRLISEDRINDTWSVQIAMAPEIGYGMGWMLHKWSGHRVIEHGGNIDGFGAEVAFLPDDGVGFALLTNVTATPLQSLSVNLVFDALVGKWNESEPTIDPAEVQPLLGKYHFDKLKVDCTVLIQNGKLAVDVPGQMVFELKPPDENGKRYFELTDQIAASFVKNDAGEVTEMKMYQSGLEFELPREGVKQPIDITLADAQKYLGTYHSDDLKEDVKVLHTNGRLAVDVPKQMVYELHMPDDEGKWAFRAKDDIKVKFNSDDSAAVTSMTLFQDGREMVMPRTEAAPPTAELPTVDDVLALHAKGSGSDHLAALKSVRLTGTINFIHQGITGTITLAAAGMDRYLQNIDLGHFGYIKTAMNGEHAWADSAFHDFEELTGDELKQTQLQHPLINATDWKKYSDKISIDRVDSIDGKSVYVLDLNTGKDQTITIYVNKETGLVVKEEMAIIIKGAGSIHSTITYDEYEDVAGVKLPKHWTVENDATGRMTTTIEKVESNIDLPVEMFTLKPPAKNQ